MAQPVKDTPNKLSEFDEKLIKYLSHHYGLSKEDEYCVLTAFAGMNKSVREMGADMPTAMKEIADLTTLIKNKQRTEKRLKVMKEKKNEEVRAAMNADIAKIAELFTNQ